MPTHIIFPSFSSDPHEALFILAVFATTLLIFTWIRLRQMPAGERPRFDRLAIYAYRSARRFGFETFTSNESVARFSMTVTLDLPQAQGSKPLIVYLPDRDGSVGGQRHLEKSWAAAGYAVIALSQIRPSEQRSEETSADICDDLVFTIRQLLTGLGRRDRPQFDRIKFAEPVFVGCGSGAYTASALADFYDDGADMAALQTGAVIKPQSRFRHPGIFAIQVGGQQHRLVLSGDSLNDQASGNSLSIPAIADAIEHLSLAFLDAVVKDDPVAIEWLERDAERLLEPLGIRHQSWHAMKNENHAATTGF